MKFSFLVPRSVAILLACSGELLAVEPWDTLLTNSPFGGNALAVGAAPVAGVPEFRGYFSEGGEQFFSVYDPARKRAIWLRQGEKSEALTARRFDPAAQALNVEFGGQTLILPLKTAALRASPGPAAPPAPPGAVSATAVPTTDAAASEEIKRAEQNLIRARKRLELENRRRLAAEKSR